MAQISTLTIFKYNNLKGRVWAFWMMQFAHRSLKKSPGCNFYKLMGSGGVGFDPRPDWSTYALLQVWEDEDMAVRFFKESKLMGSYRKMTSELGIIYLKNLRSHGEWSGENPFKPHPHPDPDYKILAVITRATIKWQFLRRFWKYVPSSQKPLKDANGLIYTKGIGEWPVMQMATFSIWESKEALNGFAYGSEEHKKAITLTRKLGWYKEELFARFQPYKFEGSLLGKAYDFSPEAKNSKSEKTKIERGRDAY